MYLRVTGLLLVRPCDIHTTLGLDTLKTVVVDANKDYFQGAKDLEYLIRYLISFEYGNVTAKRSTTQP